MKIKQIKQNTGIATIELLIAFAILIINITAVVLLVNGGQSISIDSETNEEALSKARSMLEDARALTKEDFSLVDSYLDAEDSGPLTFNKELKVSSAECLKEVTGIVSWLSQSKTQEIELNTIFTDVAKMVALGGDCETASSISDWDNPITATSIGIGGQGSTDIDVHNELLYLTSDPSAPSKEDFFVYEFDPSALTLTEIGKINVSGGLNQVDAINNYAFTLNSETSGHLKVFDVSFGISLVASASLPNMTSGIGRSIYYYNDFIYIGTQLLSCPPSCLPGQNHEFHIYDVSTPSIPAWKGSFNVNHNINDIVVRGDYAYLATSADTKEIMVLKIDDPTNISEVGSFNAQDVPSGAGEDATSLYIAGNKLYFGRERAPSTRPDFYVLDLVSPTTFSIWGSRNLGMNPSSLVTGVIVRNNLAFLGLDNPTSGIKIINVSLPSLPDHPTCSTLNFSENSTALDMDGNFIFSANDSNDEIRVIHDQASICP